MGIEITKLLPEIQLTVNSNPDKYDPNGNGQIDDGSELSALLSEYKSENSERLTNKYWGDVPIRIELKTVQEKNEIDTKKWNHYANSPTKVLFTVAECIAGFVGGIALLAGAPLVVPALLVGGALAAHLVHKKIAANDAYDEIKAKQADKAEEIRANKRKTEEEMKAREEALKEKELEYRQNMDKATSNIDKNIKRANTNAGRLNKKIDEMNEKVETIVTDTVK